MPVCSVHGTVTEGIGQPSPSAIQINNLTMMLLLQPLTVSVCSQAANTKEHDDYDSQPVLIKLIYVQNSDMFVLSRSGR